MALHRDLLVYGLTSIPSVICVLKFGVCAGRSLCQPFITLAHVSTGLSSSIMPCVECSCRLSDHLNQRPGWHGAPTAKRHNQLLCGWTQAATTLAQAETVSSGSYVHAVSSHGGSHFCRTCQLQRDHWAAWNVHSGKISSM